MAAAESTWRFTKKSMPSGALHVLRRREPVRAREEPVLEHGGTFLVEVDHDELRRRHARLVDLAQLVVGHGRGGIDLALHEEVHAERSAARSPETRASPRARRASTRAWRYLPC